MSSTRSSKALVLAAGAAVAAVVVAGCGSSSSSGSAAASKALSNITSAEAQASASAGGSDDSGASPAAPPITAGHWRLDGVTLSKSDITSNFDAYAKITYLGSGTPEAALFEIDIFQGSTQVGKLVGNGNTVGGQQSIHFISGDAHQAGSFTYTFVPAL